MKKFIALALVTLLFCSVFLTSCKNEDTNIPESPATDFEYEENADGGITITKYIGSDAAISIPQNINNKSVNEIGNWAFASNSVLSYVKIPDTVKIIENGAFEDCYALKKVVLSDNLEEIGGGTFQKCKSLSEIVLPDSLSYVAPQAFYECSSLKQINIPEQMTEIPEGAFSSCGIETVKFSKTVERIGASAFSETDIIEIALPASVKSIESAAFASCANLEKVTLNEGLVFIGKQAFSGAIKLEEIVIPNTVADINDSAFSSCKSMKKVMFKGDAPNSYTYSDPLRESFKEYNIYPDYTVYYHDGAEGFTSPEWCGYKTEKW